MLRAGPASSHKLLISRYVFLHPLEEPKSLASLSFSPTVLSTQKRIPFLRDKNPVLNTFIIKAVRVDQTNGGADDGTPKGVLPLKLKAIVTIRKKHHHDYKEILHEELDKVSDAAGQKVLLQLVSNTLDPKTKVGKRSKTSPLQDWAEKAKYVADKVEYMAEFVVPEDFGIPGAILVLNEHPHELYLETIALEGLPSGRIYFPCYSWVHSKNDSSVKRVFFSNMSYLSQYTPDGIKDLREGDKISLRGIGRGIRKPHERVYDYDIYNDLGNPDTHASLTRPTLGHDAEFPYPRRCRTGRIPTRTDPFFESILGRESSYYVPRDETFEEIKEENFTAGSFKLIMHQLIPSLLKSITKVNNHEFTGFGDIDRLYKEGMVLKELALPTEFFKRLWIPKFVQLLENSISLQYSQPQLFSRMMQPRLQKDAHIQRQ